MQLRYIYIYIALLLLCACNATDKDGWIKEGEGTFEYKILKKGNSQSTPIEFGDELQISYTIFKGDSLIERSEDNKLLQMQIPAREFRNAWENALMLAQIGDSIAVRARFRDVWATMERYEKLFKQDDKVISHFKIHSIRRRDSLQNLANVVFAQEHRFISAAAMTREQAVVSEQAKTLEKFMQTWLINSSQGTNIHLQKDTILKFSYEVLPSLSNFDLRLANTYAQSGDTLIVYYATMLTTGQQIYDNAFARNTRFEFVLHNSPEIIPAFHHAAARLMVGQRGLFLMPPALAYGADGSPPIVPPNSQILLYLQLVGIIPTQAH